MSDKIRELALQAFLPINEMTTEGVADRYIFDQEWFQEFNRRFAELIIRDCARCIQDFVDHEIPASAYSKLLSESFEIK